MRLFRLPAILLFCCCVPTGVEGFQDPARLATRTELAKLESWNNTSVDVVVPAQRGLPTQRERLDAKRIMYLRPTGRESFNLTLVSDPRTGYTYVVRGGQSFYLLYESDLVACAVGSGTFSWAPSYFKAASTAEGMRSAVSRFATEIGDDKPVKVDTRVKLKQGGVPREFFSAGSSRTTAQMGLPTLEQVEVANGIIELTLQSEGGRYQGTFWINLQTEKLVRAVVDGKEVFGDR